MTTLTLVAPLPQVDADTGPRAKPTLTLVEPVDPVPPEILKAMVDLVREPARRRGDSVAAGIFATADGRVAIEYRAGEYVRVSFLGDGPVRSRTLPPAWPA